MRTFFISLLFLVTPTLALAAGGVKIIEYPDHFEAELTGETVTKEPGSESAAFAPQAVERARTPYPTEVMERKAQLNGEIRQLEQKRLNLLGKMETYPPEEAVYKQKEVDELMNSIQKKRAELIKISRTPPPGN